MVASLMMAGGESEGEGEDESESESWTSLSAAATLIDIFVDNNKTERDETRKGRDLWRRVDPSGLQ